jgi:hypothetical protein
MNYCKHLKKRKNKPYCNILKKEITLSQCQQCVNKEYRIPVKGKIVKKSTLNKKSPLMSGKMHSKTDFIVQKKKIHHTKKRITVSKEVYNAVIQRDNYSCRLCGSTNWLQLHHIFYRSERKDLINDIDNCIMLCENCHRIVHFNKKKWQPILLEMNKKNC